jgi:glycosyltransferase involved in cell wall biosynthesis
VKAVGATAALSRTAMPQGSGVPLPRVACFTPLSPVASGISYYSEDLLPILAVVVDGYTPTHAAALTAAGATILSARDYDRAARAKPFAAAIYQMGNSPAHAYMYARALDEPGVVVLHDVVLHHLRLWMAFNGGRAQRQGYVEELRTLYGAAGEALAREVLRGKTPATLFDYPLVEPILAAAPAIIVHSAASAARLAGLRPGSNVRVVSMGVPLPELPDRAAARERLGVAPDAFLVVSHGHVNPYKRLDVALRAFRRLATERPDAQFLIAGSEAPGLGATLERQVGFLGLGGRVRRLGFVTPETVNDLLAAADCCINLRYPSAGETSASLLRIMGAGLPVIVSDAGSFSEVPPGCVVKIPVGRIEEPLLAEYLIALSRDEALRAGLGAAARTFVAEEHSVARAATGYLDVLSPLIGRQLSLPNTATTPVVTASTAHAPRNQRSVTDVAEDDPPPPDPLLDGVADALGELRLTEHEPTVRGVARDLATLGLGSALPRRAAAPRGWSRWMRRRGR